MPIKKGGQNKIVDMSSTIYVTSTQRNNFCNRIRNLCHINAILNAMFVKNPLFYSESKKARASLMNLSEAKRDRTFHSLFLISISEHTINLLLRQFFILVNS